MTAPLREVLGYVPAEQNALGLSPRIWIRGAMYACLDCGHFKLARQPRYRMRCLLCRENV